MDDKTKHLEFIQGVVNRLSQNSFLLKGWSVVLISALFALSASDYKINFVILAYVPAVVLWGLDGYFLQQERLFRALYDYVRLDAKERTDFSMDTSKVTDSVASWLYVTLSPTLFAFHGVIIAAITIVLLVYLA